MGNEGKKVISPQNLPYCTFQQEGEQQESNSRSGSSQSCIAAAGVAEYAVLEEEMHWQGAGFG